MRIITLFFLIAIVAIAIPVAAQITPGSQVKHDQMLYPTVRVRSGNSGGSGTIIHSQQDAAGQWRTFVITCHHVVDDAISIEKKWDPQIGRDIKKETRKTVSVEQFQYNDVSRVVGQVGVEADIVAYNEEMDLALLELRDNENQAAFIARLFPRNGQCYIYDPCFAVGAALGHPPISTEGMIVFLDDEIDDQVYWMSNAQIIFGNSGGAVYRPDGNDGYQFIGLPARVAVAQSGFSQSIVTHMGYFIPIPSVYSFLEDNCFTFIWTGKSIEACEAERKVMQDRQRFLAWPIPEDQPTPSSPTIPGPGDGPGRDFQDIDEAPE